MGPYLSAASGCEPGDLLLGDGDGLVAVPAARADEVIAVAIEIEQAEAAIRDALAGGQSLRDARAAVGYHTLQRRRET